MTAAIDLLRPDLRDFAGYASARRTGASGKVWLNANEAPLPSPIDGGEGLNRYPDPQPLALRDRLAQLYGVQPAQLAVTRGSDEGIDLLVRGFCRAGQDAVLVAPPCFGMYAVSARLQQAPLVEVPLLESDGEWRLDIPGILSAVASRGVRVLFLCSPGNPTGQAIALAEIETLALALDGKAMLVIDEAYGEYSSVPTAASLIERFPCLVVLRTLSKAHALAGARIGAVLAEAQVIAVLRNLSAPYPVPAPSASLALKAMDAQVLAQSLQRCSQARSRRDQVAALLAGVEGVRRVYPSQGNFLLVRFLDAQRAFDALIARGVVVRDMRAMRGLGDALRITIGTDAENQAMLDALRSGGQP